MVVKVTKGGKSETLKASELLKTFQKDFGDGIGSFGGKLVNAERIPTGIFELDLGLGGGFPRGKVSIIFGPESSGKTNAALLAIANHQRMYPKLTCAFVDIEHGFDPAWAAALGVDVKKLIVIKPSYAEQAVDMVESLLYATDCGLVVVDSLAALVTSSEIDSSAEKAVVGGAALVIGKLTRKTTLALSEAEKEGRYPTLIYINQISYKIGVMFGDPETQPGGKKPLFQASIILRLYGKNKIDGKVSQTMPVSKETTFIIRKYKTPIYAVSGKFEVAMCRYKGLKPGQSDDFGAVSDMLKSYGQFDKSKTGKGWSIAGVEYPTIADFKEKFYGDPDFGNQIRQALIDRVTKDNGLMEQGDGSEDLHDPVTGEPDG
ncbi:hypothetical protein [Hyphomicrobium sp.]|uniref:hypothetical protein n=1 Tax=Hyphomicrobium sp. TaxID=82 RepID=UPI001D6B9EFE|nr:hypothetical protein [Hyphomicrobium sp.]MBY0560035.1 DNA recombination/repair protein RecA [Hyphomicrobium sp.]